MDVRFKTPLVWLPTRLLSEIPASGLLVEAPYELQNPSSEAVIVVYQGASCGCTNVRVNGKELKPADRFDLAPGNTAEVQLVSRLGAGSREKSYTAGFAVEVLPGELKQVVAETKANVLSDIEFVPQALICEFTRPNHGRLEKTLTVKRHYRAPACSPLTFGLSGLPATVELIYIKELSPPGPVTDDIWSQAWEVKLAIQPQPGPERRNESHVVSFTFNGAKNESLPVNSVPLIVRWAFGVSAPKLIRFGSVTHGGERSRRILVRSMDGKEFAIRKAEVRSPEFSLTPPTVQPRSTHWLDITYRSKDAGTHQAQIILETDHPDSPLLAIDVTGTTVES